MRIAKDKMVSLQTELILFTISFFICALPAWAGSISPGERRVGGPCEYKNYEGHAVVTSISPMPDSKGTSDEKYAVKFHFYPDEEIQEPFARTEGKEFLLMVKGSYPGSQFLKRHRIRVGKVLHGTFKVITKGTCTPTLFEFPFIKD